MIRAPAKNHFGRNLLQPFGQFIRNAECGHVRANVHAEIFVKDMYQWDP
jgi:hypothetical protein